MATFVLVAGAWHGGWCWKRVVPFLRAAGHEVYAPTLTGLGERVHLARPGVDFETHVQDIVNVLEFEDLTDVTLVGHSYGGLVIGAAADRMPERISRLIYLDALIPVDGKSLMDIFRDAAGEDAVPAILETVEEYGDGWRFPPPPPGHPLLGVTDDQDAAWMAERLTPQPFGTWTQPVSLSKPARLPSRPTAIYCSGRPANTNPMVEQMDEMARNDPALDYLQIDACHDVMVTEPEMLAGMLIEIAG